MKRFVLSFLLVTMTAAPAWAANDSREKQMLRRLQQQVQQIEQARAQAEQEKAAAVADKDSSEHELNKLRSGDSAAKRQLAGERAARSRTEAELKTMQSELEGMKLRMADTEKKLADSMALQRTTAEKLAQTESAKKQTESQLAGNRQDLKICQTHNGRFYSIGREMMQKYRDKSCQDALAQAEPFSGLKKVEVENLLETWRDRLDREKLGATP